MQFRTRPSITHAVYTFLESTVSGLIIRFARPEDRGDVFEISSTVWEGNDYLPEVWDAWIFEDPSNGFLMVGEIGKKVVAVQHLEIQPENVAWLEGIRVHERYRNLGVARRMLKHGLELARRLHLVRARLSVSSRNEASKALVTSEGFCELDRFYSFTAPSSPRGSAHPDGTISSTVEDLPVEASRDF